MQFSFALTCALTAVTGALALPVEMESRQLIAIPISNVLNNDLNDDQILTNLNVLGCTGLGLGLGLLGEGTGAGEGGADCSQVANNDQSASVTTPVAGAPVAGIPVAGTPAVGVNNGTPVVSGTTATSAVSGVTQGGAKPKPSPYTS